MQNFELLTSPAVQEFIQNAFKRKMDALQVSTALNKAGYSNEERAAIMDYMALVPKFREKFFGKDAVKIGSGKSAPLGTTSRSVRAGSNAPSVRTCAYGTTRTS